MIYLIFEIIKVIGWGVVLFMLFKHKTNVPINIFYLMLISTILMLHSELYDIVFKHYMTKNLIWFPTDILVMAVYTTIIREYTKYKRKIQQNINKITKQLYDG